MNGRIQFARTLLLVGFAAVGIRCAWVMVIQRGKFIEMGQRQFYRPTTTAMSRGIITDRSGELLAVSLDARSYYLNAKEADSGGMLEKLLPQTIGVDARELDSAVRSGKSFIWLKRRVSMEDAARLDDLQRRNRIKKIPGLYFQDDVRRQYPLGTLASHVIGTCGLDNHGLAGIEFGYDKFLAGDQVGSLRQKDGKGRDVEQQDNPDAPPAKISLTLDVRLQRQVEQELDAAMAQTKSKTGVIIVEDVRTGEILAMASRPSFDPNGLKPEDRPWIKNPAVNCAYEPGSVFKVVTLVAGLDEGLTNRNEKFWCENGSYKVADRTIHDHEPLGMLSLEGITAYSSNVGFAKLGVRLGRQRLWRAARKIGFGTPTGVQLSGELPGKLRAPSSWSGVSAAMVSFGQEVMTTPLQVLQAYVALANDGEWVQPQIIRRMERGGKVVFEAHRTVIRRVVSRENARMITGFLAKVVEYGTGKLAAVHGYRVAGKTGTAQKIDPLTKKYSKSKHTASFCGFIPADKPRFAALVMLDEPQGDYYAGTVVAPVFSRVVASAMEMYKPGNAAHGGKEAMAPDGKNEIILAGLRP